LTGPGPAKELEEIIRIREREREDKEGETRENQIPSSEKATMESHESFGRQLPKYAVDKLDSQRMNGMSFDAFFQDLNRITLQSAARYSMSK